MDTSVIVLVLLALQVCHSTTQTEAGYHCPKLYFYSKDSKTCLPCTLCGPGLRNYKYRRECKEKNEKTHSHHKGQGVWCDDPRGKLPECPPLHDSVRGECSKTCREHGRQFAPGCVCKVGCLGQLQHTVSCTHHLQWNDTFAPENCTSAGPQSPATEPKSAQTDVIVPCVIGGVTLIVLIGIIVYLMCRKPWKKEPASFQPSEAGSTTPFIMDKESDSDVKEIAIKSIPEDGETKLMIGINSETIEATQVLDIPKVEVQTETCNLQTRTAPPQTADSHNGVNQESWRALQALLESREDVEQFTIMLDQEADFGNSSWHNVAHRLLQWTPEKIKSLEYKSKNCRKENPRDGFMWKVLEEAYQKGYGLQCLLECLESCEFRHKKAEQFLKDFMAKMKSQNELDQSC